MRNRLYQPILSESLSERKNFIKLIKLHQVHIVEQCVAHVAAHVTIDDMLMCVCKLPAAVESFERQLSANHN